MLLSCIRAENQKLRRSAIYLACILLPVIPAVMGTFNYLQALDLLTGEWYSLWSQYTLFYSMLFYAPLIALYASYLWRLEHLDHNWNVFMTMPVPITALLAGKLFIIIKVTFITQLWLYVLFIVGGKFAGLSGMPPFVILLWTFRGTLAASAIGSLQLLLSMCIRSFAVPIGIALAGGITGLFCANLGLGLYSPYSLLAMGMNSNRSEDVLSDGTLPFVLSTLFFFSLIFGICLYLLKHKDVKA